MSMEEIHIEGWSSFVELLETQIYSNDSMAHSLATHCYSIYLFLSAWPILNINLLPIIGKILFIRETKTIIQEQ